MDKQICTVPGCGQLRHKHYKKCIEHMRELWRDNARRSREKQGVRPRKRRCPICNRTSQEAALFAALGVTCAACGVKPLRPNKQNGHIPCASAKIIAPKFGAEEGLLVMDGYIIERLPMPETEGELFKLLREYSDQNYWIAELC